ncbi:MAG TPA: flagellar biosynthetic protein FliO [Polyangiaceae bacterium]|nr:flagellar biosynthetic protein FliO [Polyangiaceae bacterium]
MIRGAVAALAMGVSALTPGVLLAEEPVAAEVEMLEGEEDPFAEPAAADQGAPASAPPAVPSEPDASAGAAGSWLRQSARSSGATASDTGMPLGLPVAGLLLAALGVGAVYQKRRRRAGIPAELSQLRVVASAQVGPKAQAVVASIGGKLLLLGVTEHSVNSLGWLEDGVELEPLPAPSPAAALPAPAKSFRDVLFNALGAPRAANDAPSSSAAAQIAGKTTDVFQRSARPVDPFIDVEGQAAGLVARLQRRP